jgi:transcriptional regulator with XRE-family HTH domain
MYGEILNSLRMKLCDKEYSEGYAESFLNTHIATQIKVIREQREMTQAQLGEHIGTTQAGVSRYENVDYSSWSIRTLLRIARAFNVRLRVSFEPFGSLPSEVVSFSRKNLERTAREDDPGLGEERWRQAEPPVDIGAFKALASTNANNEKRGVAFNDSGSNNKGTGFGDVGVGLVNERGQDSPSRLHWAAGR